MLPNAIAMNLSCPLLLANITWSVVLLALGFVFVSVFMILVVLIQKPKGGGLSGAFGGAGGTESSFVGAKIGDFLTWLTVGCFVLFLLLAMLLTWTINPTENAAKAGTVSSSTTTSTSTTDGADTTVPTDDSDDTGKDDGDSLDMSDIAPAPTFEDAPIDDAPPPAESADVDDAPAQPDTTAPAE